MSINEKYTPQQWRAAYDRWVAAYGQMPGVAEFARYMRCDRATVRRAMWMGWVPASNKTRECTPEPLMAAVEALQSPRADDPYPLVTIGDVQELTGFACERNVREVLLRAVKKAPDLVWVPWGKGQFRVEKRVCA